MIPPVIIGFIAEKALDYIWSLFTKKPRKNKCPKTESQKKE